MPTPLGDIIIKVDASELAMKYSELSSHFKGLIDQLQMETLVEMCIQCGHVSHYTYVPPPGVPFLCKKCGAELP